MNKKNIEVIDYGKDMNNNTSVLLQNIFDRMGIQVVGKHGHGTEYGLYFKYNNQYDDDNECPNRMCIDNENDVLCTLDIRLDTIKVGTDKIEVIEELLDQINPFLMFGTYDVEYVEDGYYEIQHSYWFDGESQDLYCIEPVIHEIIRNHRLFVPLILETIRIDNVFKIVCNDIMKRFCSV